MADFSEMLSMSQKPSDRITKSLVDQSPSMSDIFRSLNISSGQGIGRPQSSFGEIMNQVRGARIKEGIAAQDMALKERQVAQQDQRLAMEDERTQLARKKEVRDQIKQANGFLAKALDAYPEQIQDDIIKAVENKPEEYDPRSMDEVSARRLVHGTAQELGYKPKDPKLLSPEAEAQRARIAKAGKSETTVNVGGNDLAKEMAKGRAKDLGKRRESAVDATQTLTSNAEARKLLDSGAITGFGAEFRVGLGKALQLAGFNFKEDAVANTDAFVANRAGEVAKIIKAFGAGTGLSDADREFAQKAAGGQIEMTEKAIRRILDISDRASRNIIKLYNEEAGSLQKDFEELTPFLKPVDVPEQGAAGQVQEFDYVPGQGIVPRAGR